MSAPPKTVIEASAAEAAAIRAAVRAADVSTLWPGCVVAGLDHVDGLVELLSDPRVSGPIYDLPAPIDHDAITAWVRETLALRETGEAILVVAADNGGRLFTYSRFTIWPERASAEIAGAFRADTQSVGVGKVGAAHSFDWMFRELKVRLICATAALDNIRSARVIEAAGFKSMGERLSVRADGTRRRSLYWELSRDDWAQIRREGQPRQ